MASNNIDQGQGMLFCVDSLAKEFSIWPDGSTTDANITQFDDGASEAKECVKYAQNN
jgi:hypothetical protein